VALDPALWWNMKVGVCKAIAGLALAKDDVPLRVYSQVEVDDAAGYDPVRDLIVDLVFPCVLVTTAGEVEEVLAGDTRDIEWGVPYRVFIADVNDRGRHKKESVYSTWRKGIWGLFHQARPLADIPEATSSVQPGVIFDPNVKQYERIVSSLLVRLRIGESRR
jgi:hypothetical protein